MMAESGNGARQLLGTWKRRTGQQESQDKALPPQPYAFTGQGSNDAEDDHASNAVRLPISARWATSTSTSPSATTMATRKLSNLLGRSPSSSRRISSPMNAQHLGGTSQDAFDRLTGNTQPPDQVPPVPPVPSLPVAAAFGEPGLSTGSACDETSSNYTYNSDWAPHRRAPAPPTGSPSLHDNNNNSRFQGSSHEASSPGGTLPDPVSLTSSPLGTPPSSYHTPQHAQRLASSPAPRDHHHIPPSSRAAAAAAALAAATGTGASESDLVTPPTTRGASPKIATPPPSTRINVPRFDKRGYPIKTTGSVASTLSSSPTAVGPNSPRPGSIAEDDLSRYPVPLETDTGPFSAVSSADCSPVIITPRGIPRDRLETIRHSNISTVNEDELPPSYIDRFEKHDRYELYNEKYQDDGSNDSHFSAYGVAMPAVYYEGGEPKPQASLCGSMDGNDEFSSTGDHVYTDFGLNAKGRRQLVSMLDDPQAWANLGPEDDDDFHNPEVQSKQTSIWGSLCTVRGFTNVGCVAVLVLVLVVLFAGYPILTETLSKQAGNFGGFNLGGINASGQLPDVGPFQLIDRDTPPEAFFHKSLETGEEWELVFSDEFNNPGRTFYPGDDPYWQAEDYHYWSTNNLEWYDPRMLITKDGYLEVTLTNEEKNGLQFTGGLMTTWNRFCFTGGYIETRVVLPGSNDIWGLWPAIWTLGNLGRAGYGGTLDGMWPYTYDSCDVGTLKNQTLNGQPKFPKSMGDKWKDGDFSYLPGQRLSRCTCGESAAMHPGPKHPDGTFVGRGAPEIDIFEAVVDDKMDGETYQGRVSMSAQWAPFNPGYHWVNTSKTYTIYNESLSFLNDYQGSVYQQATSVLVTTDQECYDHEGGCFQTYGFEYDHSGDDGYITWMSDGAKAWTIRAPAMQPNQMAGIGTRPIPQEPMYIIINLGISNNFGDINFKGLDKMWPVKMMVDYIRVYQDPKKKNIGCDPPDFPTAAYIKQMEVAYNNPNITTYDQLMKNIPDTHWPKNQLIDSCMP